MNKKQVKKVIEQEEFALVRMNLMERYVQRKIIEGKKMDLFLGKMQRDIKVKKDYLIYLNEVLKEYES